MNGERHFEDPQEGLPPQQRTLLHTGEIGEIQDLIDANNEEGDSSAGEALAGAMTLVQGRETAAEVTLARRAQEREVAKNQAEEEAAHLQTALDRLLHAIEDGVSFDDNHTPVV